MTATLTADVSEDDFVVLFALACYQNWADTLPVLREWSENDLTPWLREKAKELVELLSR